MRVRSSCFCTECTLEQLAGALAEWVDAESEGDADGQAADAPWVKIRGASSAAKPRRSSRRIASRARTPRHDKRGTATRLHARVGGVSSDRSSVSGTPHVNLRAAVSCLIISVRVLRSQSERAFAENRAICHCLEFLLRVFPPRAPPHPTQAVQSVCHTLFRPSTVLVALLACTGATAPSCSLSRP